MKFNTSTGHTSEMGIRDRYQRSASDIDIGHRWSSCDNEPRKRGPKIVYVET